MLKIIVDQRNAIVNANLVEFILFTDLLLTHFCSHPQINTPKSSAT